MNKELVSSGIEWIGNIPKNWEVIKVKNIFKSHKDIVGDNSDNYDRISLTLNGVIKRDKDDANGLQPENFNSYQIVCKNDIIFKLIDLENINTSRVGRSNYEGITSPVYILLHEKNSESKYYDYYFDNLYYQEVFNNIGGNGVRSAINKDDLLNIPLLFPPIDEQEKIATYLDKKCAKIDEIIEDNKREINLVLEYKRNKINECVTKGLRKNNLMKKVDSIFYESIPNDWKLMKLKHVASFSKGNGITKEEVFEDGDIQCVRYGEIYSKYDNSFNTTFSKTKTSIINNPKYINKGDILFAATGELIEEIGKNILYEGDEPCLAGGDIIIATHNQDARFLNYSLNSINSQNQKSFGKMKLKVVHIYQSEIGNIQIALPEIEEQKEISDYLDKLCLNLNKVIEYRKSIIEKLEEYKKSLIYECVTGKKEVN